MGRLGNGGVDVQSDIKRGENAPSLYRAARDLRCLCHTTAGQALSSPCHLSNARPMGGSSTIERCRNNRQRRQPHQIAKARHERTLEDIGRPGRIGDYSTAPPTGRVENWRAHFRWRVSSRALSIARWVHSSTMATVPAPATSNGACGFPALRFPVRFMPRVMGPIMLGALSAPVVGAGPGSP